jgi:hypothetical protein
MFTDGFRRIPGRDQANKAARPRWTTYREATGAFQIDHLSHWQVMPLLTRLTRRPLGPITAADRLIFRHHDPFLIVTLVQYESPEARDTEAWLRLVKTEKRFAAEFGEREQTRRPVVLPDGARALEVASYGPVRKRTFRFHSLLVPRGATAWRVTVGADRDDWSRVDNQLGLVLASFHAPALSPRPKRTVAR